MYCINPGQEKTMCYEAPDNWVNSVNLWRSYIVLIQYLLEEADIPKHLLEASVISCASWYYWTSGTNDLSVDNNAHGIIGSSFFLVDTRAETHTYRCIKADFKISHC